MSKVRQKQVFDGQTGVTHYEITFTALAHDWIPAETYEEVSEYIYKKINDPEAFELQTVYDALSDMMSTWRIHRHVANEDWKKGFQMAWLAVGGVLSDLN